MTAGRCRPPARQEVGVPGTRVAVIAAAAVIPLVLLAFGVYGSFSFTFSIPIIWQFGILGEGPASLGLARRSLRASLVTGILSGVILAFLGGYLLKALGMTGYSLDTPWREVGFRLLAGDGPGYVLSSLAYCVFLVGLGEEIFWRGFIQQKVSRVFPGDACIWVTAVIFGLVHSYLFFLIPFKAALVFLGLITLVGAFWGYLYEYFGTVWAPALSHGIIAFVVWRYFVF